MVLGFLWLFALATKFDKNHNSQVANRWKRRISIAARRGMMDQAHYAPWKHLRYSLSNRDDVMDDGYDHTCRNSNSSTKWDEAYDEIYLEMKGELWTGCIWC